MPYNFTADSFHKVRFLGKIGRFAFWDPLWRT